MATVDDEIRQLISDRQLSQWHLMIASLLGSLASQHGIFNQAFLNRLLKHSMQKFIIPYFQTLPEYQETVSEIPKTGTIEEKFKPVIDFIDNVFHLAGDIELLLDDEGRPMIKIGSSGCRFCPIGVGKADLQPGMTFCPFPTMIEETARFMTDTDGIKIVIKREGTKTRILEKRDGACYITYAEN